MNFSFELYNFEQTISSITLFSLAEKFVLFPKALILSFKARGTIILACHVTFSCISKVILFFTIFFSLLLI